MIVRLAGEADVPAAAALERATFSEGADEAMMAWMLSDGRKTSSAAAACSRMN